MIQVYPTANWLLYCIIFTWPTFVKIISNLQCNTKQHFAKYQEAVMKDVARALGMLQSFVDVFDFGIKGHCK
jgi:hypothetical protein